MLSDFTILLTRNPPSIRLFLYSSLFSPARDFTFEIFLDVSVHNPRPLQHQWEALLHKPTSIHPSIAPTTMAIFPLPPGLTAPASTFPPPPPYPTKPQPQTPHHRPTTPLCTASPPSAPSQYRCPPLSHPHPLPLPLPLPPHHHHHHHRYQPHHQRTKPPPARPNTPPRSTPNNNNNNNNSASHTI